MILVVIPTFREPEHVSALLSDLGGQDAGDLFEVVVVNASPGDETTALVEQAKAGLAVSEIAARRNDFWTASVARGIRHGRARSGRYSGILLLNCDLRVPSNLIAQAHADLEVFPNKLTCYAAAADGRYVTSGVSMRSWLLSWTRHEPRGRVRESAKRIRVDMLAGRALLIPVAVADRIGVPDAVALPHYGADYEYSHRGYRVGGACEVSTVITVISDVRNTGARASHSGTRFSDRARMLWNKRSPSNLLYLSRFVWLTYPKGLRIGGLVSTFVKTFAGVVLGPHAFRAVAGHHVVE